MRATLRFLCVIIMLQVSTPLIHAMNEEEEKAGAPGVVGVHVDDISLNVNVTDEETSRLESLKKNWLSRVCTKVRDGNKRCLERTPICIGRTLIIITGVGVVTCLLTPMIMLGVVIAEM